MKLRLSGKSQAGDPESVTDHYGVRGFCYLQLHTGYTVRWDFMDIPL